MVVSATKKKRRVKKLGKQLTSEGFINKRIFEQRLQGSGIMWGKNMQVQRPCNKLIN